MTEHTTAQILDFLSNVNLKVERYFISGHYPFIVPQGVTFLWITACAGGGGGSLAAVGPFTNSGGGGGGGQYTYRFPIIPIPGETLGIYVGAGGPAGISNNRTGGDGQKTTISRNDEIIFGVAGGGGAQYDQGGIAGGPRSMQGGSGFGEEPGRGGGTPVGNSTMFPLVRSPANPFGYGYGGSGASSDIFSAFFPERGGDGMLIIEYFS